MAISTNILKIVERTFLRLQIRAEEDFNLPQLMNRKNNIITDSPEVTVVLYIHDCKS